MKKSCKSWNTYRFTSFETDKLSLTSGGLYNLSSSERAEFESSVLQCTIIVLFGDSSYNKIKKTYYYVDCQFVFVFSR